MGYWPKATLIYGIKLNKEEELPEDWEERETLLEKHLLEVANIGDSRSGLTVVAVGQHVISDSSSPVKVDLSLTSEQMEETKKIIDQFCEEMGWPKRKLAWWMCSSIV